MKAKEYLLSYHDAIKAGKSGDEAVEEVILNMLTEMKQAAIEAQKNMKPANAIARMKRIIVEQHQKWNSMVRRQGPPFVSNGFLAVVSHLFPEVVPLLIELADEGKIPRPKSNEPTESSVEA